MKKFLIAIPVVLLCAATGLGIFIATFNVDRYCPVVAQKISQVLGLPVELSRLSLVWKNGLAVRLENFSVYSGPDKKNKLIQFPQASAIVRWMPLFRKEVQIRSVNLLEPVFRLARNNDGSVQGLGGAVPETSSVHPGGPVGGKPALFSVDIFEIENGQVYFDDSLSVRDLEVKVKNFSLTQPFSFDAAGAFFSVKQNMRASGRLKLPQAGKKGFLEKVILQAGLADWDLVKLGQVFGAVKAAGLEGNLGGKIELRCDYADLEPRFLNNLQASVKFQNGAMKLRNLKSPFEKIQLNAQISGDNLQIENFSANFAGGVLKASGTAQQFQAQGISLAIEDLSPQLGGRLSLDFKGGARSWRWSGISQTLSGQGHLSLEDGVLLNYNLLREVIQKISIIPRAERVLQEQLPDFYKAKLGEPNTILKPIDVSFQAQNGKMLFDRLVLATDLVSLEGSGELGLDKTIRIKANLRLDQELSGVMIHAVPQIQFLTDSRGRVEIPVQINGRLPQISVLPDKDYLTQKLFASTAQQFVTSQVRNLLDKPAAAGEAGLDFKNLLNRAIGNTSPQDKQ